MLYRKQIRNLWFLSLAARVGRTEQRAGSNSEMRSCPKRSEGDMGVEIRSNGI